MRTTNAEPVRNVVDLPPSSGYLAREIERLPLAGALHGDEDFVILRDGKALRGSVRELVELASRGVDRMISDKRVHIGRGRRAGGGGGRHTFENSVARAPETTPDGTERMLVVRDGETFSVLMADLGAPVTPVPGATYPTFYYLGF